MQVINHLPYEVRALGESARAGELFSAVLERLNDSGVEYALGSGTALGIHRDKALIPSDTDLDFMVFVHDETEFKKVKTIMQDIPLAVEVTDAALVQQLAYYVDSIIIDFHFYRKHREFYQCNHQAGLLRFFYSPTKVVSTQYGDVRMVGDIEYMLQVEYGDDWQIPRQGKKGVFIKHKVGLLFGSFDPLHYGHIRLFRRCRAQCETLHVVVRSDEHIRKYKGREPFLPQEERYADVKTVVVDTHKDTGIYGVASFAIWAKDLKADVFFISEEFMGKVLLDIPTIFMPRTQGVSSSQLRTALRPQ